MDFPTANRIFDFSAETCSDAGGGRTSNPVDQVGGSLTLSGTGALAPFLRTHYGRRGWYFPRSLDTWLTGTIPSVDARNIIQVMLLSSMYDSAANVLAVPGGCFSSGGTAACLVERSPSGNSQRRIYQHIDSAAPGSYWPSETATTEPAAPPSASPSLVVIVRSATETRFIVDDFERVRSVAPATGSTTSLWLGSFRGIGLAWHGYIYRVLAYPVSSYSAAFIEQLRDAAQAIFPCAGRPRRTLVAIGSSLSVLNQQAADAANTDPNLTWPFKVAESLPDTKFINHSTNGLGLNQAVNATIPNFAERIASTTVHTPGQNHALLWPGPNDLTSLVQGGSTQANAAATTLGRVQTAVGLLRNAGYATITIPDTVPYEVSAVQYAVAQTTLNAGLYANGVGADAVVRLCDLPEFDAQADSMNTSIYLADKLHHTVRGNATLAPVMLAGVQRSFDSGVQRFRRLRSRPAI